MSNIDLIIEEKAANIGNFLVGRLLPFRQKRAVGPFVFIDHMGPKELGPDENLTVYSHPHIGLSTLTFLFEGTILHKDSLGNEVEITPGAVNWMTAGKGVVHAEKTPERLKKTEKSLHGMQIWVALPKELEDSEPSFTHITANEIPSWSEDDVSYKLIAGKAFGKNSPVPVHSHLYFIEIRNGTDEKLVEIGDDLYGESAMYILEGGIKADGESYSIRQLLVSSNAKLCSFVMEPNTTLYIFGGEPYPEERFIHWNFVSSDKSKIDAARIRWKNQEFPKVPGETKFVPLPEPNFK